MTQEVRQRPKRGIFSSETQMTSLKSFQGRHPLVDSQGARANLLETWHGCEVRGRLRKML